MLVVLLFLSSQSFCQLIRVNSFEVSKKEYEDCPNAQPVLQRDSGGDDTLNAGDMKFKILGSFKSIDSFTFMRSIPDSTFYVVNNKTGWVDRLEGYPTFSSTLKEFVCLSASSPNDAINLYEIKNNQIMKKFSWPFYKTALEIRCVTDSSFYVKDVNNHYWKYQLHSSK